MVRFIHTADWQIGMTRRWLQGEAQARYADARLEAVRRIGELARREQAEFVVVAGDVFESNLVASSVVRRGLEAMREIPVPVYLLPGNHDPLDASSIYQSAIFRRECPAHVTVLDSTGPVAAPGAELIAAPWSSKWPESDLVGDALEAVGPTREPTDDGSAAVRIVVGHGAVDLLDPDRHNKAAIALAPLEAALHAGRIHYVALGDRHSCTEVGSTGAVHYSGTQEVTAHRETEPGKALVVDVTSEQPATVSAHQVGTWSFGELSHVLHDGADVQALAATLDGMPGKERTVIKLSLTGALSLGDHAQLQDMLERQRDRYAALIVRERHTDLVVMPEGEDLSGWGISGFVAAAAEEISQQSRQRSGLMGSASSGEAMDDQNGTGHLVDADDLDEADDRAADASELPADLQTQLRADHTDDPQSARDALALLYRLTASEEAR